MKVYKVGGAVRDYFLNKEPNDIDYVVVGSTITQMLEKGFQQVGKDFPVFLEPKTKEEYALARKEVKTGDKHTDFEFDFNPNVTLEEDLKRRDFTINAIAIDTFTSVVYDPFQGLKDLHYKVIKHVCAEHFVEDPLRILRGARLCAQLGFRISPSTMKLFKKMVDDGMLEHLTPERVWKETEKALNTEYVWKYFKALRVCGALKVVMPEIDALWNAKEQLKYHPSGNSFKHTMIALTKVEKPLDRWAVVCHDLGKALTPNDVLPKHSGHDERGLQPIDDLCSRLKAPTAYKEFALLFCRTHMRIGGFLSMTLKKQYDMIYEITDCFKNENNLVDFMNCTFADWTGEYDFESINPIQEFYDIKHLAFKIFHIMNNVGVKDLPLDEQESLSRFSGKDFGTQLRALKIAYLRKRLV